MKLYIRELRDGRRCEVCGAHAERVVTVDLPMRSVSDGIMAGDTISYCSLDCAATVYPEQVGAYRARLARWEGVRDLPLPAVVRRDGTTRMAWHPSPIESDERKAWDDLQQESRRLNRR